MPRAGQSPGSEEARLLRAGALAGPRFPIRTRRGGWGHRAPSRTKPGASLARQVVHLGAGAASFCLVGSLSVAMRAPRTGPQGGPGAGVLGSQPTGAEPGSRNECYLCVAGGFLLAPCSLLIGFSGVSSPRSFCGCVLVCVYVVLIVTYWNSCVYFKLYYMSF